MCEIRKVRDAIGFVNLSLKRYDIELQDHVSIVMLLHAGALRAS